MITIDHPYDTDIVSFPDNSTVLAANISTTSQIEMALSVRVADVSFVLDQLNGRGSGIPGVLQTTINPCGVPIDKDKYGIFGHSLGGAQAFSAMVNDSRIAGAVNLDGTFFGPAIGIGTSKPLFLVGHEGKSRTSDESWGKVWQGLRGWRREISIVGTQHGSFTDLPVLINALGLEGSLPSEVGELLGTIEARRGADIVRSYASAFFDLVLRGERNGILKGESREFPEVKFVN